MISNRDARILWNVFVSQCGGCLKTFNGNRELPIVPLDVDDPFAINEAIDFLDGWRDRLEGE